MLDWYLIIRAARYLGVSPWDLLEQPIYWLNKALESESIDDEVARIKAEQEAHSAS